MKEGDFASACPKFAESQRLDPGAGTLLNLASCYEKNGQTASAWATYKDAAAEAKKMGGHRDWEVIARKHAVALEANLSKMTIEVPATMALPDLEVQRDGVSVTRAEWGLPIPVDPGPHVVKASAPHLRPWTRTLDVAPHAPTSVVTVPALEAEPEPVAAIIPLMPAPMDANPRRPSGKLEPNRGHGQRVAAVAIGALGLASVATGSAFGLLAKSRNDEALQPANCPAPTLCNANGLDLTRDAQTFATVSTITFAAGGGLVALGTILYLLAPAAPKTEGAHAALHVTPTVGSGSAGITFEGSL